jgi:hypothetical protein
MQLAKTIAITKQNIYLETPWSTVALIMGIKRDLITLLNPFRLLGLTGSDRIGCLEVWILKRLRDCNQCGCQYAWKFEQGFRKGMYDLEHAVGIGLG